MSPPDFDITLDQFGQRLVTIFTQISFCFSASDNSQIEGICTVLEGGLDRLARSFPWLAGQVICEGATATSTGTFKIKPLDPRPRFVLKDLRDDPSLLSRDELKARGYPMKEFNEKVLAPRNTNSGRPGETVCEVFQLQATIIRGGLILTFLGQHQAMDGTGLAQVINLFHKACRGDRFKDEELRIGNLSPDNVIPLYGETWQPGPELEHNIVKDDVSRAGPGSPRTIKPPESGVWCLFNVSAASIAEMKAEAAKMLDPYDRYVSTDDLITALVYQAITWTRWDEMEGTEDVYLARAVDLRRYLGLSPTHPGFVQSMTYAKYEAQGLRRSLTAVASMLREQIDPKTTELPYHGRSFATLISRINDKTRTSYIAGFDMSKHVMISSWANQNSYFCDFGLGLGKPEAVRRPYFDSFPGLAYLLPKAPNGDIAVAVCLSAEHMEKLIKEDDFTRYATFVG
jgi:trichothecene 3-O-acetyltransferase